MFRTGTAGAEDRVSPLPYSPVGAVIAGGRCGIAAGSDRRKPGEHREAPNIDMMRSVQIAGVFQALASSSTVRYLRIHNHWRNGFAKHACAFIIIERRQMLAGQRAIGRSLLLGKPGNFHFAARHCDQIYHEFPVYFRYGIFRVGTIWARYVLK